MIHILHPSASSLSPLLSGPLSCFFGGGVTCARTDLQRNALVLPSHCCPSHLQRALIDMENLQLFTESESCQRYANQYPAGICRRALLPGPSTLPDSLTKACCCTSQRLRGFQQHNVWKKTAIIRAVFPARLAPAHMAKERQSEVSKKWWKLFFFFFLNRLCSHHCATCAAVWTFTNMSLVHPVFQQIP